MNYYYSGQGSLYVAERDAVTGSPKGFIPVGNVPALTINIAVTKFEHKESESGSRLLDLVITKEKTGTFQFTLENLSLENLALGLYGSSATVSSGAVTDEIVKFYAGKRMPLAHPNVSAVVVKDSTETTTYTAGEDYTVDADNGVLIFPSTGADPDEGDELNVAYSYGGYSKVDAFMASASPERWLRFEGLNTVDDTKVVIDIFRAQFDPLTNYGLINEDIAQLEMNGSILSDSLRPSGSKFFQQRNIG
jgi:hypothetical protein